jgi:hypothetical protein
MWSTVSRQPSAVSHSDPRIDPCCKSSLGRFQKPRIEQLGVSACAHLPSPPSSPTPRPPLPRFPRPSSFSALSIEARKPARPHTSGTRTLSALVVPRFPDSQATSIGFVLPNPDSLPRPSRGLGWAGNGRSCRFFRAASSGRGAAAR